MNIIEKNKQVAIVKTGQTSLDIYPYTYKENTLENPFELIPPKSKMNTDLSNYVLYRTTRLIALCKILNRGIGIGDTVLNRLMTNNSV